MFSLCTLASQRIVASHPNKRSVFYDRLGSRQDWQGFFGNPAIHEMIAHAAFDSTHSVFEFGCGTGALAANCFQHHLPAATTDMENRKVTHGR